RPAAIKPTPMAPPITAPVVNRVLSQQKDLTDIRSTEQTNDLMGAVATAITSGTATTVGAVEGVKKMIPVLAKNNNNSDDSAVLVKIRNSESSQASYVSQIFEHPAMYGGSGTM